MLICPSCSARLSSGLTTYRCAGCGIAYPVVDGVPTLMSGGAGADGYDERFFSLFREERWSDGRHFWFRARNELIFGLYHAFRPPGPRPRLLEVGCGTGVVLEHFVRHGVVGEGLDAHVEALRICRERAGVAVWCADARRLPFDREFEALGLFDCLEHIHDDVAVLREARRALKPGGLVLVTVPAGPALWSELDAAIGHVRRYTRSELRDKLQMAGFEIAKLTYYSLLTLPFYWLHRRWLVPFRASQHRDADRVDESLRVPPSVVNEVMYRLMRAEQRLLRWGCSLPYGASLAAVARRSPDAA